MSNIYEDAGPLDASQIQGPPREERKFIETLESDYNGIYISPEDIQDEYEYNENFTGLFVLFNHDKFVTSNSSTNDQINLVDCLKGLRYEVKKDSLNDFSKKQVEDELKKIADMDHSKRNSLIIVFLTHDEEDDKLYCQDGEYITCQEVWSFFTADKCPGLRGKPKIFIFQACKGGESSIRLRTVHSDSIERYEMAKTVYTLPDEADILVAYSTFKENRDPMMGYWFIQELCKNFTAYGCRDDIMTLFTRILKCVDHHYKREHKQKPCFISTLTRKFYVSKSNERGFILDVCKENDNIVGTLQMLEEKVKELVLQNEEK